MDSAFSDEITRIGAGDNDWLGLTSDDQRQVRVSDGALRCVRFLLAAVMCGMTAGAQAADLSDLPILRGGLTEGMGARVNWSGVYVGGQVTRGAADMDFTNSGQDLLAKLLNNVDRRSAVQHLEMAGRRAGPCVGHRLWRLCRIQFPMDRCGHRRRTELHPRYAVRFLEGRPGTYLPVSDRLRYDGDASRRAARCG